MAKKFIILLAATAAIGIATLFAQEPGTSKPGEKTPVLDAGVAAHEGLDEIYRRFSEGYKRLDPAAVANLYTDTAAYLVPGTEIEIGREKILASFTKFFDSGEATERAAGDFVSDRAATG